LSVKSNYEKPSIQRDGIKPRGVLVIPTVVAVFPNVGVAANAILFANVYSTTNALVVANANGAVNANIGANWNYNK
jgi:hypothetical protein